ncbi:MAG: hypothetical protein [Phage AS32]|nr:MAG: hypothetical protein [Phage AS32]
MIDPNTPVFPQNVVNVLGDVLPSVDSDVVFLPRPLRPSDPHMSLGVYGTVWMPDEESYEMGHIAPGEATLGNYQIGIQTLVKDGDSQRGLNISSILSYRLRTVLYRNEPLRLALGSLNVQDGNFNERMRRWKIRSQRFMSNDIEGSFVTTSVMDLWIETEMS